MRSQALFRLLLLPPALDRSCDLLVSSAIFVKPCPRKRFALARCHFADFSSPGFSGLSSVDIIFVLRGAITSTPAFAMSCSTARSFYTLRRVAGWATPTDSAGHAGATANPKLTFHLDHSAGAISLGHGSGRPW